MENDSKKSHFNFESFDNWKAALNKAPNEKWIKQRFLNAQKTKSSSYIPLFIQSALADVFFREFDIVSENYMKIDNEILCTIKISFLPDYPDSEHRIMTGTAAKPIQQGSNAKPESYPDGKKTNALEYNAPASRSAAISNALTTFANVFGRNLNRDIRNNYSLQDKTQKKENND